MDKIFVQQLNDSDKDKIFKALKIYDTTKFQLKGTYGNSLLYTDEANPKEFKNVNADSKLQH